MTTTTETKETAKKKGSKPTDEIFPVGADGKPNYKGRIPAWKHSKGEGRNFSIGMVSGVNTSMLKMISLSGGAVVLSVEVLGGIRYTP